MLQVPWFQVGTPFLVSTEISASVADDIVEYQQDRRSRASHSVPGHSDEPEPSRPKTFMRRYCASRTPQPACMTGSRSSFVLIGCRPAWAATGLRQVPSDSAVTSACAL